MSAHSPRRRALSLLTGGSISGARLTFRHLGTTLGFYGATAAGELTVTGSRGGNAAPASLLTDSTTA